MTPPTFAAVKVSTQSMLPRPTATCGRRPPRRPARAPSGDGAGTGASMSTSCRCIELKRPGPSYTVDTLAALARPGETLFLILGSETFLDLLSWREPRRVAQLARLVIVPRVGSPFDADSEAAQKVLREIGVEGGFTHVGDDGRIPEKGVIVSRAASMPISASELRRRVREGRSLAFRLPPAVAEYIAAHGLYRDGAR